MDIKGNINRATEDIAGFFNKDATMDSRLSTILHSVIGSDRNIWLDSKLLRDRLEAAGVDKISISRIILLTELNGFEEFLLSGNVKKIDLENFINNAVHQSGLKRDIVIYTLSDMAAALGIDRLDISRLNLVDKAIRSESAFVIPKKSYEEELKNILGSQDFEASIDRVDESTIDRLIPLAAMGISKAKYYLGYALYKKAQNIGDTSTQGIELLHEAAQEGEPGAARALGDYYYERGLSSDLAKAHEYYTGYGSVYHNQVSMSRLTDILNQSKFNAKLYVYTMVLIVLSIVAMIAAMFIMPSIRVIVAGIIAIGLECFIGFVSHLGFKNRPYDDLSTLPLASFILWCVYALIAYI